MMSARNPHGLQSESAKSHAAPVPSRPVPVFSLTSCFYILLMRETR
jgi:hypothetical protein